MAETTPQASSSNRPLPEKIFAAGTLRYSRGGLFVLFSWLLWNDLCVMLMLQVAPNLAPLLMKDHGATNKEIALFSGTLPGLIVIWLNPLVSTWSDRHRGPYGRRRPFLLFATPFCALALAAIPFMPDFFHWLMGISAVANFFKANPSVGIVALLGMAFLAYQVFNTIITAIFGCYFWDVVPEEVLGRFSAMTNVVGTLAAFVWSYFIFGLAETHMKAVFVCVALFFFVAYMTSIMRVKEGEYPPPPPKGDGLLKTIGSYFTDCYTPYYLWFLGANAITQLGNLANGYQIFMFRNQLHLSLDEIGKMRGLPTLIVVAVGYSMGAMVDRLKPGRVMIVSFLLYGLANIGAFFWITGKWSLCFFMGLIALIVSALKVAQGVFQVEFYPRAKLGQFCSANQLLTSLVCLPGAILVGSFLDRVKDYRYSFLWATAFYFLSVPLYIKCYANMRRAHAAAKHDPAAGDAAELEASTWGPVD